MEVRSIDPRLLSALSCPLLKCVCKVKATFPSKPGALKELEELVWLYFHEEACDDPRFFFKLYMAVESTRFLLFFDDFQQNCICLFSRVRITFN